MRDIQDLPNEVLMNVFRLGCDDPEYRPSALDSIPSHARRRKKLIENARCVCFRWRRNLDLPYLPYGHRFWFARLSLSLREDPLDYNQRIAAPSIIRDRLIRIREIVSTLQGCDVIVVVDGRCPTRETPGPAGILKRISSYEDASPGERLSIKLFLHGATEILRQHSQSPAITVVVHLKSMQKHIVELLADWGPAPQLQYINIDLLSEHKAKPILCRV
jgi:hypothetical protein